MHARTTGWAMLASSSVQEAHDFALVAHAATSGVQTGSDVVKAVAVGADVAMVTSAILRFGAAHVSAVESELRSWLAEHDYSSVGELRGSMSQANSDDGGAFERANYLKTLHSWTTVD